MTADNESLVLEILKKIQSDQSTIKEEMKADRLWKSSMDSHLTSIHLEIAQVNARIDGLSRRIDRLETRLGLVDA